MSTRRRTVRNVSLGAALMVVWLLNTGILRAQEINGVAGSPDATMSIKGNQLPPPPMKFGGVINQSYLDSKPWWPPRGVSPRGAPPHFLFISRPPADVA